MITVVNQSIFKTKASVLCHAVNCYGVMGAGLAKDIKDRAPYVYSEYKRLCDSTRNKENLLGTAQLIPSQNEKFILREIQLYNEQRIGREQLMHCMRPHFYANLFTQKDYGRDPNVVYTKYRAVESCFRQLSALPEDMSIAMPYMMCCGLANGDWTLMSKIIRKYFKETKRQVIIYKQEARKS